MRAFETFLGAALLSTAVLAQAQPERMSFPNLELRDGRGGAQSLASSLGRATIVNFWATWCGPCRMELPELQALYNGLAGRGAVVIAVAVDTPPEQVPGFMKRNNLSLPVYFLDPVVEASLAIPSVPTTVLLDREGKVVQVWRGYSKESMKELHDQTEALLSQPSGDGR